MFLIGKAYIKGFYEGIMKTDESIKIIFFDWFGWAKLLKSISPIISFLFDLFAIILILNIAGEITFLMLNLDLKIVRIIIPLPCGIPAIFSLWPFLQLSLLGVDDEFDSGEIRIVLVDIDRDFHPGSLQIVAAKWLFIGVVDDIGGVVLVLFFVEEEDGLGC